MNAKRKRPDAKQMHEILRNEREKLSRTIIEQFPNVNSIKIELSFKDEDMQCDPDPRVLVFENERKAFFELSCPFHECISGGFDFSSEVTRMIHSNENNSKGNKTCNGWQDAERINKHRCLLKAIYSIQIEYVNGV